MVTRMLIVQHGEKLDSPGDPGLSWTGRAQAIRTATWLRVTETPTQLVSSPMRRAVETANPLATNLGLDLGTDERLSERMNWDGSDGRTHEQFLEEWAAATADRSYRPSSGDSSVDAAERFLAALTNAADRDPDGTTVVVTHGGVTTDALRSLAGDDAVRSMAPALLTEGVPNCAITELCRSSDGWSIERVADTAHLVVRRY